MGRRTRFCKKLVGFERSTLSHKERLISVVGGFISIAGILLVTTHFVSAGHAALLVASMGASAVLLFAVPHGALSQPWPVFGGHVIAALIGVSCAKLIPGEIPAAAVTIGLVIGAMHYLRCIHPPGGATGVTAIIGGAEVHQLGYSFVLTPVLLNALLILIIAVAFNNLFAWRRYPAFLLTLKREAEILPQSAAAEPPISHEDFVYALQQMDSFIDISEADLLRIYDLAHQRSESRRIDPEQIRLGAYYSNGSYGSDWSVRLVVDQTAAASTTPLVIYKVVAGQGRRSSGYAEREEFARWAHYEVYRDDENWRRVEAGNEESGAAQHRH